MPFKERLWQATLCVGALLWAAESGATTIERQSLGQLVDEAPLIFIGDAVDQRTELLAGHTSPTTLVTFQVQDLLKGATEDSKLTLAFEGGEWNDEIFEVIGMPSFETGRRYLLFLRSNGAAGGCPTAGWWQGKLDFIRHPLSGNEVLVDHRGIPIEGIAGGEWQHAAIQLDSSGRLLSPATPGVEVEQEDGVTISDLPLPEADSRTHLVSLPEAQQVLGSLRRLIRERQRNSTFRAGETFRSADADGLSALSSLSLKPARPLAAPERP